MDSWTRQGVDALPLLGFWVQAKRKPRFKRGFLGVIGLQRVSVWVHFMLRCPVKLLGSLMNTRALAGALLKNRIFFTFSFVKPKNPWK